MVTDFKKQGKKNRKKGGDFERLVRKDLESKGYTVCKWSNNVECEKEDDVNNPGKKRYKCIKLMPAKHKFNPFNKVMTLGTGFPDFIAFKAINGESGFRIMGVEAKTNGYLDQEEKAKCRWLVKNNIFNILYVAKKEKIGGEIKYEEFN